MTTSTICLFFSDTGGGHRSATEAIEAGLQSIIAESALKDGPTQQWNIVSDNIVEKTHFVNRVFVELYNFLLRNNQAFMKYYYDVIHQFQPDNSELGYHLAKTHLKNFVKNAQPDLIVSIHPMLNHYLGRSLKECDLSNTKFVIVVTDPNENLWRGWACPYADLTIAPNEAAKNKLLSWGIPENKVQVVGMPVHPDFTKPAKTNRHDFLTHLDLDPSVFTLCINTGWAGGGNMQAIYEALSKLRKKIQVIFLCGNHDKLYKEMLENAAASKITTRVLPFHDNMSDLMNAADLMVTKAGGLTTFEAIARRLPMAIDVITDPMPQETGTIDILMEASKGNCLAHIIKKPEDIVEIVENTIARSERPVLEIPAHQSLDNTEAVYDIARILLECANPAGKTLLQERASKVK